MSTNKPSHLVQRFLKHGRSCILKKKVTKLYNTTAASTISIEWVCKSENSSRSFQMVVILTQSANQTVMFQRIVFDRNEIDFALQNMKWNIRHKSGGSQTFNLRWWAREDHFLIFPHFSSVLLLVFSHFSSICPYFLPQFGHPETIDYKKKCPGTKISKTEEKFSECATLGIL